MDQLCISYVDVVMGRGSAQREALDLRARVTESKLKAYTPAISAVEMADAVRNLNKFLVLLQSVAAPA